MGLLRRLRERLTRRKDGAPTPRIHRGRARDRFNARDLFAEAAHGIGARPGRLVLTILGTVLGIASVVITVGLAQTAAGQISRQFDAVAATQVVVVPEKTQTMSGEDRPKGRIPWDGAQRVAQINGVLDAGLVAAVDVGESRVTAVPVNDPSVAEKSTPQVLAGTGGLLDAVRGHVVTGRFFDEGHDARKDRVVVLGERAAERLGVNRVDSQPSIFIGENAYTVIGIFSDVKRRTDLLDAVVLPAGTAQQDFAVGPPEELQIHIETGAGSLVTEQAPIALDPNSPEVFKVQAPADGSKLQQDVQADINAIFLALGGIALLVGGLGIANVTLLSVMERVGEIGLRRALGATKRDIAGQFVVESVVIGLLGGLVGASLGVFTVVIVSVVQDWTPILDIWVAIGSALLGGVIGLLAGTYPALKAAAIEPIAALRGGI